MSKCKECGQSTEKEVTKLEIKNFYDEVIYTSTKTNVKDAIVEAVASGVNLSGADLNGVNLRSADLSGAYLSGAYLRHANLSGADFRDADLRGVDFSGADLSGVNLRSADLRSADLSGVNLSDANLMYVKFGGRNTTTKIKENQTDDFFKALGIEVIK